MKLAKFDDAAILVRALRDISDKIKIVRDSNALGVTIQGTYQDEAILKAVRPYVVSVLEDRKHAIIMELTGLGVYGIEDEPDAE